MPMEDQLRYVAKLSLYTPEEETKLKLSSFNQIMTPKARADIHMNLPALQKLDSMLIVSYYPFLLIYFVRYTSFFLPLIIAKYTGDTGLNGEHRVLVFRNR